MKRKSSIIQRELEKERVEEKEVTEWELLPERCLEYTVCRGFKGGRVNIDHPLVRNYQSTAAPLLLHVDVRGARKHLAGRPGLVVQRHLQCNKICCALFQGKLFVQDITLEQFIHTGSHTVWPQSELPPACRADTSRGIILL